MFMVNALILPLALSIDRTIGDPKIRFHPVALIGSFIGWWGRPGNWRPGQQRVAGVVMWIITVTIFAIPFYLAEQYLPWFLLLAAGPFLLKFCLAWRSLEEHSLAVSGAVSRNLGEGRREAALMVSRDTGQLTDEQVLSAAYESLSENLVDSIISPIFYFGMFGLSGAAVFRAANTMDAMLGYRDERERIGWFSARMDDILNYIPARMAGILLLLVFAVRGRFSPAYGAFKRDRRKRPGLNGGIPMAILAGGAGVQFEKPGVYTMGAPERSLKEGGPEIISAVRAVTVIFSFAVMMVLIILGSVTICTGI
ncbi:MAG TPA: adenosylcobinamide-phosphate synthase CbiB [Methanoregulaceae archaeon]|nr:adenosylcobinamide-phosphate synthase CbiB [Methanoregulaceae archaeon]HPD09442.1 adenosylcobinamide-phosphate synthase CbiB [Methanoregulaceae archaeon]HRT14765.1 adenosylcobinamide-phosphate synthase CbiB [Methanoregulaceae archaeon]HRU30338.1 adenosylcobinamide-phosphate synthase CbiB [Methanoregulaceae archaeon]